MKQHDKVTYVINNNLFIMKLYNRNNQIFKNNLFIIFVYILVSCQSVNAQEYFVNNFDISSAFNHNEIITKIGTPNSKSGGGTQIITEFGWNTFTYNYGSSYIDFNDTSSNAITSINITDTSLSINSITVGDPIIEAKQEFLNYIQKENRLIIELSDYAAFSIEYDSNHIITRISFVVFT